MKGNALAIQVERRIYLIRGEKVMLSFHLAELYGVETKALNRAVKRNRSRFPPDFMFQLSWAEWDSLKYQIGTSNVESIDPDQLVFDAIRELMTPVEKPKRRIGFHQ